MGRGHGSLAHPGGSRRPRAAASFSIPAEPASCPLARAKLRGSLTEFVDGEDVRADVLLAAGEAVANAIEHAYAGGKGLISIALFKAGGVISIEVVDSGQWRTYTSPDRGRGFDIMRALVDEVAIERSPGGTRVRLVIDIAARRNGIARGFAAGW